MEFGPVIKNPVLDINKLVRQGTMLNQSVQNVEGDSTADQATVDLLARKDPVIQEIAVGISGEELTQYTVSGTPPLSLPNSLGKPLKAWSVDLLPYQEGTGDPSPSNVRPIHGTDKLNLFVEESYDQSATPKAVLTLPQTVYTGTIGSEGGESRTTAVDMGDQSWFYHSGRDVFYYVAPDGKPTGMGRSGYGMCEAYKVMEGTSYGNLTDGQAAVGTNFSSAQTASVVVKDSRFTDAAQFKAAVSGIKLVYEIATPTEFAVTSPTIPTPRGSATTWATAEDGTVDSMEVTYVGKA